MAEVSELYKLLSVHPRFRVLPVECGGSNRRVWLRVGRLIARSRLLRFGAEFANTLALVSFRVVARHGELEADFRWHAVEWKEDWTVFLHFLDAGGEIRFQGDHPLAGGGPDALGFFAYRRMIAAPPGLAAGAYRIRLGVWKPAERRHLELTRFRGCSREKPGWCHNAVLLGTVNIPPRPGQQGT